MYTAGGTCKVALDRVDQIMRNCKPRQTGPQWHAVQPLAVPVAAPASVVGGSCEGPQTAQSVSVSVICERFRGVFTAPLSVCHPPNVVTPRQPKPEALAVIHSELPKLFHLVIAKPMNVIE